MQTLNIVYILLHFPYLTETFIAEEISSLRSKGFNLRIISLLKPGPGPTQPASRELLQLTWYAPGMLTLLLWRAQIYYLLRSPRVYIRLLTRLLRQPYSHERAILFTKRLYIFLKSVTVAYHLRNENIDLFHAHFAWLSGAGSWICSRLLRIPFTVTVHAFDVFVSNDLLQLLAEEADHIVAISDYNRRLVESLVSDPKKSVSVIHCGVSPSALINNPVLEHFHPDDEQIRILSVGSLLPKKGHSYLIEACHLLKERGLPFICTIIGTGPDENSLRRQIHAFGLEGQVKLPGAMTHPEIIASYYQHEIFVLASVETPTGDMDGIPVVLMEAGAAGLPLISTNISGIPELVRDGETGLLAKPGDPASLANKIFMLATDPERMVYLGLNAQKLVTEEFSIDGNVSLLAELFRKTRQEWQAVRADLSKAEIESDDMLAQERLE